MGKNLEMALGRLACLSAWAYVAVMAFGMPFYFEHGYEYIGTEKSLYFHKYGFLLAWLSLAVSAAYGVFVLARVYRENTDRSFWELIKRDISRTDLWMLLYLAALLLSYLFSRYPATARMGNDSWYMGFLPHLALVVSYFVLSRVFRGAKVFFAGVMAVTTAVFGLAVLNRYGVYPIAMEYATPAFISTIGNINWYCGYWAVLVWVSVLCFWNGRKGQAGGAVGTFLCGCAMAVAFATGVSQGSDSGILALGAGMLVLFSLSADDGKRMARFLLVMTVFGLVCAAGYVVDRVFPGACTFYSTPMRLLTRTPLPWVLLLFFGGAGAYINHIRRLGRYSAGVMQKIRKILLVGLAGLFLLYVALTALNTLLPAGLWPLSGNGLFTFDRNWGSSRGGTWSVGVEIWKSQDFVHKMFGVGPDCMGDYIYQSGNGRVLSMVREQFGNGSLLNAHGEWVTNLVNLGLFGAVAFAGVIIAAFCRFIKAGKQCPVMYVFAFAVLGYTVNNIFSFQTTLNTTQLFIMLGVGESLLRRAGAGAGLEGMRKREADGRGTLRKTEENHGGGSRNPARALRD